MITIAFLDDEKLYIDRAKVILSKIINDGNSMDNEYSIHDFLSSADLFDFSSSNNIDVLVLDIHMSEPDGLRVAEHFHEEYPDTLIIFLSSYEEYVFYSLRFSPFRFVRKSQMNSELTEALSSAILSLSDVQASLDITSPTFTGKIPYSRIKYIEKLKGKNYLTLYCVDDTYTYRQNISDIEKQLDAFGFTKINAGALVNMKFIHHIGVDSVYLQDGTVLKISGGYGGRLKAVKEAFVKYMRKS